MRSTRSNSRCPACRGPQGASKNGSACLQQQVEADEAAVAKRRQALRERFAKKLAEADAAAVELQETVARAVVLFRKIIDIRETARAAWPISRRAPQRCRRRARRRGTIGQRSEGVAGLRVLSHQSADPFLGGQPGERRQQSLPGAVSPRIDQQLMPSAIKPFADALKQASAFAVEAMGTKLDPLRALTSAKRSPPSMASAPTRNSDWRHCSSNRPRPPPTLRPKARPLYGRLSPSSPDYRANSKQEQPNNDRRTSTSRTRSVYDDRPLRRPPRSRKRLRNTKPRRPPPPAPFPTAARRPATTPAQAAARLAQLKADPAWRASCSPAPPRRSASFRNLVALAARRRRRLA